MGNVQRGATVDRPVPAPKQEGYFTDEETALVRSTWNVLQQQQDIGSCGVRIFLRIFDLRPEAKQLFPFRDIENDQLQKHFLFRAHATRFMQAIGVTVANLDAPDVSVTPTLVRLGKEHVKFSDRMLDYFDVFNQAVLEQWREQLGIRCTPEVEAAWIKVFTLIMMSLKEGYVGEKGPDTL